MVHRDARNHVDLEIDHRQESKPPTIRPLAPIFGADGFLATAMGATKTAWDTLVGVIGAIWENRQG